MTQKEWLTCTNLKRMLRYLRRKASQRKLRLFISALARQLWPLLPNARSQRAVKVSECFADGMAERREMTAAGATVQGMSLRRVTFETALVCDLARSSAYVDVWSAISWANPVALSTEAGLDGAQQEVLFRDIFGNPFRRTLIAPAVLAWHNSTIPRLAQAIYEERQMPSGAFDPARMNILADAFLDAGCDNEDIIQHCRHPGPHVRGCWPVDLILGKS